jgi:serine/threonine-protein kinase
MAHLPDSVFLAFQQALAGRYSIDRELGRGGMGIVYLAREVHLDRLVAIKLLPPAVASDAATRERFLREARLSASLSHPHIVPMHAVDQVDGFVFFVMAFVDGETLAQRVQARGPVPSREATRWLREVAWALSYAHSRGVVHRDIKPDNILIERESGRALVADFGIASITDDGSAAPTGSALHRSALHGTPEFMSPEQALGGEPGVPSDIYALGVTAYYALSGRVPFTGESATQVLAQHRTSPVPPLTSLGLVVPRKLAQLVERCLAKTPDERPASADVIADQLGEAIEQRRELPVALRAFVKRNGRMDGGGTLLTLIGALAGGVGISTWLGPAAGVLTIAGTMAVAPLVFGVTAARRLMQHGFAQPDLGPAFASELESVREEHSVQPRRVLRALEWAGRSAARIGATTSASLVPFAVAGALMPKFQGVQSLLLVTLSLTSAVTIAWLALLGLSRDVDVTFWRAAWTGRFGRVAFARAKRWRGTAIVGPALTHRATELSLSLAAEQLFESLPRDTRAALGNVPAVLQRLQVDAQQLRQKLTQLQDVLGDAAVREQDASFDTLREERARVQQRMQDAVASLETLRLGLLRLHAGSMTVDGFTTRLGVAEELSADVARLVAAQAEVQQVLFPQYRAPAVADDVVLTPV